jgi:polyferredoxin
MTLGAVYLLAGLHFAHWRVAGRTLAPLELNEVLHTLHLGIVTAGFLFMAVVLLATVIVGRFFCSWACHILALQDLAAWLLARVGIHPKPLRSRALAWVPFATMAYLFVWPQVARVAAGEPAPHLRVVSGASGWTSFVTDDMWRNLPSPAMALLTFAVCGFVIVYVLGSRSFCTAVCPYGVLFGAADRVAPGRIVAAGP